MKKIVIVIGNIKYGGAERIAVYLANYLCDKSYDVTLVSYSSTKSIYNLKKMNHINLLGDKKFRNSITRFISLVKMLRKTLLEINPDVVLGMMSYNGLASSVSLIGTGIPVVTSERIDPASTATRTSVEKFFYKLIFSYFTKGLIFQTNVAKSYYSKRVQNKSVIIPNPLFEDHLIGVNRPSQPTKRIISVGRLVDQKNFKMLILAFKNLLNYHPDYILDIYGEGNKREELNNLIKRNNLEDKVFLRGNTNKIFEKLQKSDMFVLSSDYEGMPNALIEAMAMGLPVISTDCKGGGARFLIQNGENGLLIPIGDEDALVKKMRKLIDDREFAEKHLGRNAIKIREILNGEKICGEWEENLLKWSK